MTCRALALDVTVGATTCSVGVWVGGGSAADYLGRVVAGKAVLIQDIPRPGTLRHSIRDEGSVARAFERGGGGGRHRLWHLRQLRCLAADR